MNYNKHFLEEDIRKAKGEVACIADLSGGVALSSKKLNQEQTNQFLKDLEKSVKSLNEMYLNKQVHDEAWLKWKQIEGSRQQIEFINKHLKLNDKEVESRRSWY